MSKWLREHAGRGVTEGDVAEIFAAAYGQAANMRNAVSGFEKSGLHPYNPDIFTSSDFIAADVTDMPLVAVEATATMESDCIEECPSSFKPTGCNSEMETSTSNTSRGLTEGDVAEVFAAVSSSELSVPELHVATEAHIVHSSNEQHIDTDVVESPNKSCVDIEMDPLSSKTNSHLDVNAVSEPHVDANMAQSSGDTHTDIHTDIGQTLSGMTLCSFADLIPQPKRVAGRSRKRKVAHAEVVTDSPYKAALVEAKKFSKPKGIGMPVSKGKASKEKVNKKKDVGVANTAKDKVTKRSEKQSKKGKQIAESEDHSSCGLCGERYGDLLSKKTDDDWLQCSKCRIWFHETCAEECGLVDIDGFVCGTCFKS